KPRSQSLSEFFLHSGPIRNVDERACAHCDPACSRCARKNKRRPCAGLRSRPKKRAYLGSIMRAGGPLMLGACAGADTGGPLLPPELATPLFPPAWMGACAAPCCAIAPPSVCRGTCCGRLDTGIGWFFPGCLDLAAGTFDLSTSAGLLSGWAPGPQVRYKVWASTLAWQPLCPRAPYSCC